MRHFIKAANAKSSDLVLAATAFYVDRNILEICTHGTGIRIDCHNPLSR